VFGEILLARLICTRCKADVKSALRCARCGSLCPTSKIGATLLSRRAAAFYVLLLVVVAIFWFTWCDDVLGDGRTPPSCWNRCRLLTSIVALASPDAQSPPAFKGTTPLAFALTGCDASNKRAADARWGAADRDGCWQFAFATAMRLK